MRHEKARRTAQDKGYGRKRAFLHERCGCMDNQRKNSLKWYYINNIVINILRLVIICISIYLSVCYTYWWLLLLLVL